jgi:hypothetical protein
VYPPEDKSKRGKKKAAKPAIKAAPSLAQAMHEVHKQLTHATLRALQLFAKTGIFKLPPYSLGSEELVFQHRFSHFSKLSQPAPLSYGDYTLNNDLEKCSAARLQAASVEAFRLAKEAIDRVLKQMAPSERLAAQLRQLLRLCVANSVCVASYEKLAAKAGPSAALVTTFDSSPYYPTFAVRADASAPAAAAAPVAAPAAQ